MSCRFPGFALGKNGFVNNDELTGKDHNPYFHRWQDGVDIKLPEWEWVFKSNKLGLQQNIQAVSSKKKR